MTPEELVKQRKEAGLSQTDLGLLVGVNQIEISRMENGKRSIPEHIKANFRGGIKDAFGEWVANRPVMLTVRVSLDVYQLLLEEAEPHFRQPEDHASFIITNHITQQGE